MPSTASPRLSLRQARLLKLVTGLTGVILAAALLTTLTLYAVTVNLETQVAQLSTQTQQVNESNKVLQVSLGRIQSFQKVEQAARALPQLREADAVLELPAGPPKVAAWQLKDLHLSQPPEPVIYGY